MLKLFDHELVVKIWDTRDNCAARTKFDKPKPFKFGKTGNLILLIKIFKIIKTLFIKGDNLEENIRASVLEQCDNYLKQIPKELHNRMVRKLPNQIRLLSKE